MITSQCSRKCEIPCKIVTQSCGRVIRTAEETKQLVRLGIKCGVRMQQIAMDLDIELDAAAGIAGLPMAEISNSDLHEQIKAAASVQGMTIGEISRLLGLNRSYVSRVLRKAYVKAPRKPSKIEQIIRRREGGENAIDIARDLHLTTNYVHFAWRSRKRRTM